MITPSAPSSGTSSSQVTANDLFLMSTHTVLRQPAHAAEQQLGVALDQGGSSGDVGDEALDLPVVEREHVVLDRLDQPEALQLMQFLRVLLRRGPWTASSRCCRRRAPRRRRRRRAAPHRSSPTACGAWSPRSSPCGKCLCCRTSRSTGSRAARVPRRR